MNAAASTDPDAARFDLSTIERCFGGAVPVAFATAGADGVPNVTYLSKAHRVDDERIALSNQFMSKSAKNLASNPRASLLLVDPITYDEFRVAIVYERTERRGRVFERLRDDVDAIAALTGMQDVFRLRSADIFRVLDVEAVPHATAPPREDEQHELSAGARLTGLAQLASRLARSSDLDVVVETALEVLDVELGYHHVHLLLLDEDGRRLFTIASRGYDDESIGAEVELGDGLVGQAAERCTTVRVGNLIQMSKYSHRIRTEFEDRAGLDRRTVVAAGLSGAQSRMAAPAMALGELVGVLVVDRIDPVAFGDADEHVVTVAASLLASAIEHARSIDDEETPSVAVVEPVEERRSPVAEVTAVRFFTADGSTFVDGDYLIKGVAGRILWSLLGQHLSEGRVDFTNLELRRDASLELPEFKDNLESRLVLLKRRLDEHGSPIRIERTGRGRFRLLVDGAVRLDRAD